MADQIPDNRDQKITVVGEGGHIPTPAEIVEGQRAEQERREQDNRQLLLDLQIKQADAQALQANSNARIARLTGALVIVTLVSGFVSFLQFQATKQSVDVALKAVSIARDARDDSNISGGDTLILMKAQNRIMQRNAQSASIAAQASRDAVSVARDTLNSGNESFTKTLAEMKRQATAANDSVNLSREQFRQDQRPYVWLEDTSHKDPKATDPALVGGQVIWNWFYTNYGKSPAHQISFICTIYIDGVRPLTSRPQISTVPVPPGKSNYSTVVSRPGISPNEFNRLMNMNNGIRISGKITYTDAYGSPYESGFCMYRLATGATAYCETNENYMK